MVINILCGICGAALAWLVLYQRYRYGYSEGWAEGWEAKERWDQVRVALENEELERMYGD